MIPGHLIALGQLTDPGVNFPSTHGLTSVTVHMSFSLPGNFESQVTRCTNLVTRLAEVTFLHQAISGNHQIPFQPIIELLEAMANGRVS